MLLLATFLINNKLTNEQLATIQGSIMPSLMTNETIVIIDESTPKAKLSWSFIANSAFKIFQNNYDFIESLSNYSKALSQKNGALWNFGLQFSLLTYNEIFDNATEERPLDRKDEFVKFSTVTIPCDDELLDNIKTNNIGYFKDGLNEILRFHNLIIEKKLYESTLIDVTLDKYKNYFLTYGERTMLYGNIDAS